MEYNYVVHTVKILLITNQNIETVDVQVIDGRVLEGFTEKRENLVFLIFLELFHGVGNNM
jgi:hypothetical protein